MNTMIEEGKSFKGSNKRPSHSILSQHQAIKIYRLRKPKSDSGVGPRSLGNSSVLSKLYGVSPKAIRDIWNRRTWIDQTRHLWTNDEDRHQVICRSSPSGIVRLTRKQPSTRATWQLQTPDSPVGSSSIHAVVSDLSNTHAAIADGMLLTSSKSLHSFHPLPKTTTDTPFPELASAAEALRAWKEASIGDAAANDPFHDDWPHW